MYEPKLPLQNPLDLDDLDDLESFRVFLWMSVEDTTSNVDFFLFRVILDGFIGVSRRSFFSETMFALSVMLLLLGVSFKKEYLKKRRLWRICFLMNILDIK